MPSESSQEEIKLSSEINETKKNKSLNKNNIRSLLRQNIISSDDKITDSFTNN